MHIICVCNYAPIESCISVICFCMYVRMYAYIYIYIERDIGVFVIYVTHVM